MIINIDSGRSLRRREVLLQTLTKAVCLQIELGEPLLIYRNSLKLTSTRLSGSSPPALT